MILPVEAIAEVAAAICRDGIGGYHPNALAELANLTDLQIYDFLCRPQPDDERPPREFVQHSPAKPPSTEDEAKKQFFAMARNLIGAGMAGFKEEDLEAYWAGRHERARKRAEANGVT